MIKLKKEFYTETVSITLGAQESGSNYVNELVRKIEIARLRGKTKATIEIPLADSRIVESVTEVFSKIGFTASSCTALQNSQNTDLTIHWEI